MHNRRRWPRIDLALRVVFRFNRPEDLSCHSTIRDISLGGVFIVTDQVRPKGTVIRLQLEFHNGAVFKAEGQVVRVVPPEMAAMKGQQAGIGVQFTEIDERSRQVLEETLATPGGS
jgi:uncharacterized protein (TIGR02266 family)